MAAWAGVVIKRWETAGGGEQFQYPHARTEPWDATPFSSAWGTVISTPDNWHRIYISSDLKPLAMQPSRTRRAYLLALAAGASLAGCSGDGETTDTPTTAPETTAPPTVTDTATATSEPDATLSVYPDARAGGVEQLREQMMGGDEGEGEGDGGDGGHGEGDDGEEGGGGDDAEGSDDGHQGEGEDEGAEAWQYLSAPDGADRQAYFARATFGTVADWYANNVDGWTVTDSYDVRDEYDEPADNGRYGYHRLESGTQGAVVFYAGTVIEEGDIGEITEILHVEGEASVATDVTVHPPAYDVFAEEPPEFVTHRFVDLDPVTHVSYFRSGYGHSYTNAFETCRSMKHYLSDENQHDSMVPRYAPTTGELSRIDTGNGPDDARLVIVPDSHPAFTIELFHVDPREDLSEGTTVEAGDELGRAGNSYTLAEPAVNVMTPEGRTLVSMFDVMTDAVFDRYRQRGVESRDDFILTKEYRDSNPIDCEQDGHGTGEFTEQIGGAGFSDVNHVALE